MLFIKQLLSSIGLAGNQLTNPSIACISTTRPTYLVFGDASDYPLFVIRKINDDNDFQTHLVHNHLFQLAGNHVPEPIGIYENAGNKYDVQRGVKGLPWFQIKSKIATENSRACLERRLWQTLKDFHSAVAAVISNITLLQPHEELIKVYSKYKSIEQEVTSELETLVELAVSELSETPNCLPISQHGDFCLNNVIIDTSHITVIDFEDFAITEMPLHDHFTLALSLPSCATKTETAVNIFNEKKIVDAATKLNIPTNAIKWHFLHHILLRLGPWSSGEKRSIYRAWLQKLLADFVANQVPQCWAGQSTEN